MKILLINPPRSPHNAILANAPHEALRFIHKKLIGPPLGLITIAAAVQHHEVTVLDMKGQYDLDPLSPPPVELALSWFAKTTPDIVGLTVITSEFNASCAIAAAIKKADPSTLLVAGGLHATLCPQDFAATSFDVVCTGQAAMLFRLLADLHAKKESLLSVPNSYVRNGTDLVYTQDSKDPIDAAGKDFIMPDRSHLEPWYSTYVVGKGAGPATYLFTSLGCPYTCSFCSIWPQFGGHYYQRDVESVIDELKTLDAYRIVRFSDANTVVNTRFMDKLFDRILQENISKEYVMDLRTDTIVYHPALIEKMAAAGLKVVISGFESFREEELEAYNKTAPAELIHQAIRILHDNDIQIRGNYVVPPEYDKRDFAALSEFASTHKVAFAGYTILTPMPGTEFYKIRMHEIVDLDYDKYNFFNCVLKTTLPLQEFYKEIGKLWMIKKGEETI